MTIAFIFWLLMLLILIFGLFVHREDISGQRYYYPGMSLLLWILLFLLGWGVFGWPIKG